MGVAAAQMAMSTGRACRHQYNLIYTYIKLLLSSILLKSTDKVLNKSDGLERRYENINFITYKIDDRRAT